MATPLLSTFYFGSVEHYRLLAKHPKVIIDIGEHYERQSYRTRTSIVGPNGKQDLLVNIDRRSMEKMPMRTVKLSYAENWPHQHVQAIRSAYGQSPWFIHYIDAIEAVIMQKYERLVDLDLATMQLGMKWLGLKTEVEVSEMYVGVGSPLVGSRAQVVSRGSLVEPGLTTHDSWTPDFRTSLHPKKPLPPELPALPAYPQVFADRHGFVPRMDIIDLVCNCGPDSARLVHSTR
jgi:WbqC-like protein family